MGAVLLYGNTYIQCCMCVVMNGCGAAVWEYVQCCLGSCDGIVVSSQGSGSEYSKSGNLGEPINLAKLVMDKNLLS